MRHLKCFFLAYKRRWFFDTVSAFSQNLQVRIYIYTAGIGSLAFVVKLATEVTKLSTYIHIYSYRI